MRYPRQKLFLVCTGPRCSNPDRGEDRGEVLREELKVLNKCAGRAGIARICGVSCLDLCDHGPNMVVEPDGTVYSHLDRGTARAAYEGEMGDGPKRGDLTLAREEWEAGRHKV
ncbi:MAG TPA: (2Fe-2S) ferredoxin domain-containing protein [Thermoanaerobaculia bacterium]|nr:(2Fe-2S) ferredoxin domain-containing protein [Thermoanaerobaculia bacterium]